MSLSAWLHRRRVAKCARVGHKERRHFVRGHVAIEPEDARLWVAWDAGRTTVECRRCGEVLSRKVEKYARLTGVSMPAGHMDMFRREGEVWFE